MPRYLSLAGHYGRGRLPRRGEPRGPAPHADAAYITGQTIFVDGGLSLYTDFRKPWSSE
jgi:hypothetical protein